MFCPENETLLVKVVGPLKTISPVLVADTFAPTVMPVPLMVIFASLAVVTISPSRTVLPP